MVYCFLSFCIVLVVGGRLLRELTLVCFITRIYSLIRKIDAFINNDPHHFKPLVLCLNKMPREIIST